MLFLLSSFPKSGNTWLRRFLVSYAQSRCVPLNEMSNFSASDSSYPLWKHHLDMNYEASTKDYLNNRINLFVKLHQASRESHSFIKTHNAHAELDGIPLFCDDCVDKVVHVVRNPLDVLPSYAHHFSMSIPEAWKTICRVDNALKGGGKDDIGFMDFCLSWDAHTNSWLKMSHEHPDRFMTVRYEDMKLMPISSFTRIINHLELVYDENLLLDTLNCAKFSNMKNEEMSLQEGFIEAPSSKQFFRKGQVGSGREEVPKDIQRDMFERWQPLIQHLGYEALFDV